MNKELEKLVGTLNTALLDLKIEAEPKNLYQPINYTLTLGGKRLRPILCLMGNRLFQGKPEDALPAALGLEIFHNFTLVHDDIMDQAPLRRGKPTVHQKWGADTAILSGDVMFVKAYQQFMNYKDTRLRKILSVFNQTAIEVCEGQQLDMDYEKAEQVSLNQYLKMIELKTAALLASSLKIGAITANAPNVEAELIYEFGKNIGLAFQIQDDYLDAYGEAGQFGKKVGGDILNNKKTYLLLTAVEQAEKAELKMLQELKESSVNDQEKIERSLDLFERLNVRELTKSAIKKYSEQALNALNKINLPEERKAPLIELNKDLISRTV